MRVHIVLQFNGCVCVCTLSTIETSLAYILISLNGAAALAWLTLADGLSTKPPPPPLSQTEHESTFPPLCVRSTTVQAIERERENVCAPRKHNHYSSMRAVRHVSAGACSTGFGWLQVLHVLQYIIPDILNATYLLLMYTYRIFENREFRILVIYSIIIIWK